MIIRAGWVRIEPLPDDFRNAPLEFNIDQKLVIPDCAKEPSRLAKVVQLGDGDYEYAVRVGDLVLCNRYPQSFQGFEWNGERYALMREDEILSVVEVTR